MVRGEGGQAAEGKRIRGPDGGGRRRQPVRGQGGMQGSRAQEGMFIIFGDNIIFGLMFIN